MVKCMCSTVRQTQTQVLAPPLTSHGVLGKMRRRTEPQRPQLQRGGANAPCLSREL